MDDRQPMKTLVWVIAALLCATAAYFSSRAKLPSSALNDEVGKPFFPSLQEKGDEAMGIEVQQYDEQMGEVDIFKVQKKKGVWTIPSHYGYPVDAKDRVTKTAGDLFILKKESLRSVSKSDHVAMGVVEPTEPDAKLAKGRGALIRILREDDNPMAELIVGKPVPDKPGFRFVRVPKTDRVYAVETKNLEISTDVLDWIDTQLITAMSNDIEKIDVKDFQIDQAAGTVGITDKWSANRVAGKWQLDDKKPEEELDDQKINDITFALADLKITGVRQKVGAVSPDLKKVSEDGQDILVNAGFFPTKNEWVARDRSVTLTTAEGIRYQILFGTRVRALGSDATKGIKGEKGEDDFKDDIKQPEKGPKIVDSQFVLIGVDFDESKFPMPVKPELVKPEVPADPKPEEKKPEAKDAAKKDGADAAKKDEPKKPTEEQLKEAQKKADEENKRREENYQAAVKARDEKIKAGKEKLKEIQERYGPWYYLVNFETAKKLRVARKELLKKKEDKPANPADFVPPPPGTPALPGMKPATGNPPAGAPEAKPATPAPAEKKAEPKPAEPKPAETKPAESKNAAPAEKKDQAKPAEKKSEAADPKPATKPADAGKAEAKKAG